MTSAVISQRVFPRTRSASIVLVVFAAGLTALAAQWRIDLPFTPVPITGQTFAVLLTSAALGMKLGGAGQLLYVGAGLVGAPVFAGGQGGMEYARTVGSVGYLIGFVFAAALIGYMAERKQDRSFATMFTAFVLGTAVIYAFGVAGLMVVLGMGLNEAVVAGVVPFVVGDIIKAASAGVILPATWRLLGDR